MSAPGTHREALLDAAQRLMLSKGYPATKVDEVCEAAGVTKGSFYHHFGSKDDLALALIDHYFGAIAGALGAGRWASVEDPRRKLLAFLDHAIRASQDGMFKRGCLLGSFALDLSETHPEIRRELDDRFARLLEVVEPVLRDALRAAGRAKPKPGALAKQFMSVLQGSIVLAKAGGDHSEVASGLRCYREMVAALIAED